MKIISILVDLLTAVGITKHQDKVLHIIVGFIVGVVSMLHIGAYAIPIVIGVGLAKELWDMWSYGGFSFFDWFATIGGGFAGIVLTAIFLT